MSFRISLPIAPHPRPADEVAVPGVADPQVNWMSSAARPDGTSYFQSVRFDPLRTAGPLTIGTRSGRCFRPASRPLCRSGMVHRRGLTHIASLQPPPRWRLAGQAVPPQRVSLAGQPDYKLGRHARWPADQTAWKASVPVGADQLTARAGTAGARRRWSGPWDPGGPACSVAPRCRCSRTRAEAGGCAARAPPPVKV